MAFTASSWNANTAPGAVYRYVVGTGWSTNLNGSTNWDLFTDTLHAGDMLVFMGPSRYSQFRNLQLTIDVPLAAVGHTLIWEYSGPTAGVWTALACVDGTAGLTASGAVTFDVPQDWYYSGGLPAGFPTYPGCAIRVRVVVAGVSTEGGHCNAAPLVGNNVLVVDSGTGGWLDLYNLAVARGVPGVWKDWAGTAFAFWDWTFQLNAGVTLSDNRKSVYLRNVYYAVVGTMQCGELYTDAQGTERGRYGCELNHHTSVTGVAFVHLYGAVKLYDSTYRMVGGAVEDWTFYSGYLHLIDSALYVLGKSMNVPRGFSMSAFRIERSTIGNLYSQQKWDVWTANCSSVVDVFCPGSIYLRLEVVGGTLTMTRWTVNGEMRACPTRTLTTFIFVDCAFGSYVGAGGSQTWAVHTAIWKHTLALTVLDDDGAPLLGAVVTIKDGTGATVYSGTTDVNGQIPTQYLVRKTQVDYRYETPTPVVTTYTPHTVTITATGYADRTLTLTMDRARVEVEQMAEPIYVPQLVPYDPALAMDVAAQGVILDVADQGLTLDVAAQGLVLDVAAQGLVMDVAAQAVESEVA